MWPKPICFSIIPQLLSLHYSLHSTGLGNHPASSECFSPLFIRECKSSLFRCFSGKLFAQLWRFHAFVLCSFFSIEIPCSFTFSRESFIAYLFSICYGTKTPGTFRCSNYFNCHITTSQGLWNNARLISWKGNELSVLFLEAWLTRTHGCRNVFLRNRKRSHRSETLKPKHS